MRVWWSLLWVVASGAACGGVVAGNANPASTDSGDAAAASSDGGEVGARDATPAPIDASSTKVIGVCGTACVGGIETTTGCRAAEAWYSVAVSKCAARGWPLVYFEPAGSCPGGARSVKYDCCLDPTIVEEVFPSAAGCPLRPSDLARGTPCTGLFCTYPDACGHPETWHCKAGWSQNSGCSCVVPP